MCRMPFATSRSTWRRARIAALAVTVAATASPAHAQERSLDIREMNARIIVTRGGDVSVTERFVVHFNGSWNGIYRMIPVEYDAPGGLNYTLRLRVESVTDDAGTPLRHEVERVGDSRRIKMWVPNANDATRTVVLSYSADNALRFFDEHDELYWNVTGAEWDFPIQSVIAEVVLPDDVTGIRTTSFTGAHGSTENAVVEQSGSVITFRGTRPLGYREDLTLVVGWNPGVVTRPTTTDRVTSLLASNSVLFAPVIAFVAMFGLWRRFGRDPEPGSVFVRYEPPPDMTPAEAGTLMDDRADVRDITATLVDLAVRGFVVIEEKTKDQLFGLISSRDYEIALVHPEQWPQLKPHERALLQALSVHSHDDRVMLSDLQNEFYKHLPEIRKHLTRTLVDGGFYVSSPTAVRGIWIAIAVASAIVVIFGAGIVADRFAISPVAAFIAGAATAIVVAVFGWLMPRRTPDGARTHTWLCGFEEFLGRVEKDRLERLIESPAAFEKFLPFAMAFGVENNWARAFEGLATQPPSWYHTSDGRAFRPQLFVSDLGRMSTAAGSAMTSAPRSSSGSSGFSGGSSGGGFGGGGGGGF
ncbi:MAG TPA: DUF2207 domain-containing protein [Longimicrobiales bacterium]|nr:DUF2207 domain-containing protein [Longimicrobiales bacterium]